MFNFSEWLMSGIVHGYKTGAMSFFRLTEVTASYLARGFITDKQAAMIAESCPAPVTEANET